MHAMYREVFTGFILLFISHNLCEISKVDIYKYFVYRHLTFPEQLLLFIYHILC